jgi:hypothetical protein
MFSQYEKLASNSMSNDNIENAKDFITDIYKSKVKPKLSSKEATVYFKKIYKETDIVKIAKRFDEYYGEVVSIDFKEVLIDNDIKWLRFKVARSEIDRLFEIRVGLNEKGKYISLANKRFWSDEFFGFNETPPLKNIDTSNIELSLKKHNYQFAYQSYKKCHKDSLFKVNETNTVLRALKSNFNERQLKECDSIKGKNGNLEDMIFQQVLSDSIFTKVYRYKAFFGDLKKPSEIRIYTNLKDKYKGVFVIDVWYDKYYNFKRAIEKSRNLLGN